jgi:hypothetical protein
MHAEASKRGGSRVTTVTPLPCACSQSPVIARCHCVAAHTALPQRIHHTPERRSAKVSPAVSPLRPVSHTAAPARSRQRWRKAQCARGAGAACGGRARAQRGGADAREGQARGARRRAEGLYAPRRREPAAAPRRAGTHRHVRRRAPASTAQGAARARGVPAAPARSAKARPRAGGRGRGRAQRRRAARGNRPTRAQYPSRCAAGLVRASDTTPAAAHAGAQASSTCKFDVINSTTQQVRRARRARVELAPPVPPGRHHYALRAPRARCAGAAPCAVIAFTCLRAWRCVPVRRAKRRGEPARRQHCSLAPRG